MNLSGTDKIGQQKDTRARPGRWLVSAITISSILRQGQSVSQSVSACKIFVSRCGKTVIVTIRIVQFECSVLSFISSPGEEIVGERDSEEIPGAVTDKEGCNERTSL